MMLTTLLMIGDGAARRGEYRCVIPGVNRVVAVGEGEREREICR